MKRLGPSSRAPIPSLPMILGGRSSSAANACVLSRGRPPIVGRVGIRIDFLPTVVWQLKLPTSVGTLLNMFGYLLKASSSSCSNSLHADLVGRPLSDRARQNMDTFKHFWTSLGKFSRGLFLRPAQSWNVNRPTSANRLSSFTLWEKEFNIT